MLEGDYPPEVYEWMKANHDHMPNVLRLTCHARAGSVREREIETAHFGTAADWPPSAN